jgi:hypothetical protein
LYDKLRGTAVRVPVPTECCEVLWEETLQHTRSVPVAC